VKDLNEPQAMNKGLLEHIAVLAAAESIAIDLKDITHFLNLDTLLVDDQDDLAQSVFAAVKRPVGQHSPSSISISIFEETFPITPKLVGNIK
jgi:hypothetical protein